MSNREETFARAEELDEEYREALAEFDSRNWILQPEIAELTEEYLIDMAVLIDGGPNSREMPILGEHCVTTVSSEVAGAERQTIREALAAALDSAAIASAETGDAMETDNVPRSQPEGV